MSVLLSADQSWHLIGGCLPRPLTPTTAPCCRTDSPFIFATPPCVSIPQHLCFSFSFINCPGSLTGERELNNFWLKQMTGRQRKKGLIGKRLMAGVHQSRQESSFLKRGRPGEMTASRRQGETFFRLEWYREMKSTTRDGAEGIWNWQMRHKERKREKQRWRYKDKTEQYLSIRTWCMCVIGPSREQNTPSACKGGGLSPPSLWLQPHLPCILKRQNAEPWTQLLALHQSSSLTLRPHSLQPKGSTPPPPSCDMP